MPNLIDSQKKKMQIKTIIKDDLKTAILGIIKNLSKAVEQTIQLYIVGECINWYNYFWKTV